MFDGEQDNKLDRTVIPLVIAEDKDKNKNKIVTRQNKNKNTYFDRISQPPSNLIT